MRGETAGSATAALCTDDVSNGEERHVREVGFTSTRAGMTDYQKEELRQILKSLAPNGRGVFHHGDCVGGDEEGHMIAIECSYIVVVHPPKNPKLRAFKLGDEIRKAKSYMVRNQDIVDECNILVAAPKEMTQIDRSGTWSTVKKARRAKKEVIVLWPQRGGRGL